MVLMAPAPITLFASMSALVSVVSGNKSLSAPGPSLIAEDSIRKLLGIFKRQVREVGFSESQRSEMLTTHNDYRRNEGATNMLEMSWDSDLAKFAQKHTEKCAFEHTTSEQRMNIGKHNKSGENIYISTANLNVTAIVLSWFNEKLLYNFDTKACTGECGHYTQVVWHESWALGCGVYRCSAITGAAKVYNNALLVNCQYAPPGNMQKSGVAQPIYTKGAPCSECPSGRSCSAKLCALHSSCDAVHAHLIISTIIMASLLIMF